ncbi:MAG: hypothetical protein OHK0013_29640 [Sandaracinaceae bacterium]
MVRSLAIAALASSIVLVGVPLRAQERTDVADSHDPHRSEPIVTAVSTAGERIVIDGSFDEPAWSRAPYAGRFRERVPHPGRAPPVDTRFRVLFDDDAIYFALEMEIAPGQVPRAIERTRDGTDLYADDVITLKIDARHDRRTTTGFSLNPAGTQLDYLAIDNGRVFRREFDTVWESAVRVLPDRWVAEVRIPAVALGLSDASEGADGAALERVIGLNVSRDHAARIATYDWAPMPPEFGPWSALHYGEIHGVTGLGGGTPINATPYLLIEHRSTPSDGTTPEGLRFAAGGEAQLRLFLDTWLETTVLTDFAQVDLDDALVNLDRFPLFFPERRPFFLTGLDVFDFGVAGIAQPFYSRRIGLDARARPVPVLAGLKLYGREGPVSFGLLDVVTDEGGAEVNQLAGRVRVRLDEGASYVGAIVVGRQPILTGGAYGGETGNHTTVGADALWRTLDRRLELSGFVFGTTRDGVDADPDETGEGVAAYAAVRYLGEWAQPRGYFLWQDEGLAPTLGFVRRRGAPRALLELPLVARPSGFFLRRLTLTGTGVLETTARVDEVLTATGTVTLDLETHDGWDLLLSSSYVDDVVQRDFEPVPGVTIPAGRYRGATASASLSAPDNFNPYFYASYGLSNAYFGGLRHNGYVQAAWSPIPEIRLVATADVYRVELRGYEAFWTYALNGLLRVTPTTALQADLVARVDAESRTAIGMLRVRWRFAPGSDLFLVWREDLTYEPQLSSVRTLTLKVSYRIDALL